MKLDKNGYRSEKRDSFATAVKVLIFIFGVGVVLAVVCLYAIFSGCGGGGSDSSSPVYDENGVCVNCNGNGDASVLPEDGYIYPSRDISSPKPDYIAPQCKVPTDPEIKKMCMPYKAKNTYCAEPGTDYSPPLPCTGKDCYCYGPWVLEEISCSTDAECQVVPCTDWPPEVCWGLPCMLVGKWQCPSGSVMDFTDMEFYDNGDGYCRMHFPQYPSGDLYNKPGEDHVQRPPSGDPVEEKYTVLDGGSQLLGDGSTGTYTCTKLVEE